MVDAGQGAHDLSGQDQAPNGREWFELEKPSGDGRDLVHILAEHAANLGYDSLTPRAREAAKMSLLDTLGVCLAASGLEPAVRGVVDVVREAGGQPQSTLLAFGGKVPAVMAALGNGALVHCLDFDDMTPWGQHCGSSIVPAAFAVAERQGGVSGRDLIAAVAAGQDIFARFIRHVGWRKDWNFSTVMGVFAATATAGRVMGFDASRLAHALGIATMQSSGIMEMVAGSGSDLRGLYAGFSAKGATLAALLAEKGVPGIDRAFEGPNGVIACYFDREYDRKAILDGLGYEFQGAATLYKGWPCVGTAHSHIKAAIDIAKENDLAPGEIVEVRLHVGDFHRLMSEPLEARRAPVTLADAKFSLPFLVAVAIVRRGMSVTDFSPAGLRDPQVLELARRTGLVADSGLDWKREMPPGRVEIIARDGRSWRREGTKIPGNADNPMDWDGIRRKFRECASVALNPLRQAQVARAEELACRLEEVDDATELVRTVA